MAQIKTVLTDLENNCAKSDGNSPGQYRIDVAAIEYGGIRHHVESYLQKIYVFEDIEKFGVTGWLELRAADNLLTLQNTPYTYTRLKMYNQQVVLVYKNIEYIFAHLNC